MFIGEVKNICSDGQAIKIERTSRQKSLVEMAKLKPHVISLLCDPAAVSGEDFSIQSFFVYLHLNRFGTLIRHKTN